MWSVFEVTASDYENPPRPVDTVHAVELDGELVLYDSATNRAAHLDARASLIWRVLDGKVTVAELVDDLSAVFDVEADVVCGDVDHLLTELARLGYLASESDAHAASSADQHAIPDPPSP